MIDLAVFLGLTAVIIPLGRRVLGMITGNNGLNPLEETFMGFGLGAGIMALLVLFIGMAGFLYRQVIFALLACLAVILRNDIVAFVKDIYEWIKGIKPGSLTLFERLLILLVVFIWFFALMGALTPELGTDAASYHMQDPRTFIEQHRIAHIPYTRESLWPFLVQMLFTLGLLAKGVVTAKLFNFIFGIFSITGVYCLCRRYFGKTGSLTAAAIFAATPAIFTSAGYAYTDLAVVFYTLVAFYCFFLWADEKKVNWFCLSAVFCGFLLGIKITSAVVPFLIVLLFTAVSLRNAEKKSVIITRIVFFSAISCAVCGVWYLRSWITLGNPIFPFAGYLFGGSGYPEKFLRYNLTSGIGIGLLQYIRIPWMLTFYPGRFGGESIGIIFLMFLPVLFFMKKPPRFVIYSAVIAVSLYTSWFIVYQYVRFLFPAITFLSILAAYACYDVCRRDRIVFRTAGLALGLVFLYSAALSVYHYGGDLRVAFGIEKPGDYLRVHERSYGIAEYINSRLPENAKVFVMGETHLFYIKRYAADAFCFKMDTGYDRFVSGPDDLAGYVRSKGFNYILYAEDRTPGRQAVSPRSPQEVFGRRNVKLLKEFTSFCNNEKRMYQVWELLPVQRKG